MVPVHDDYGDSYWLQGPHSHSAHISMEQLQQLLTAGEPGHRTGDHQVRLENSISPCTIYNYTYAIPETSKFIVE